MPLEVIEMMFSVTKRSTILRVNLSSVRDVLQITLSPVGQRRTRTMYPNTSKLIMALLLASRIKTKWAEVGLGSKGLKYSDHPPLQR